MANPTNPKSTTPATPSANSSPKPQTPPVAPPMAPVSTPIAPEVPKAAEKPAKEPKVKKPIFFDTEELAKIEAAARTEGARRPFKVVLGGETYWMVVHNWEQAVAQAAMKKYPETTYAEVGKEAKAAKAPTEVNGASIAAMLEKLSETDRKQIEEALAKLKK